MSGAACYTSLVAVSATPGLTSDSVAGSGASPDRRGNLSISRPAPEFCMDPIVVERFWEKVDKNGPVHPVLGTPCWLWKASTFKGYGRFNAPSQPCAQAHRISYALTVGPIPDGMETDHLCRIPACVNPAHLEVVTSRENTLRGVGITAINNRKTHCGNGHPLSGPNVRTRIGRRGAPERVCRACHRRDVKKHAKKIALLKGGDR